MSKNQEAVKIYICPSCFSREIDTILFYDEADNEYYCTSCAYNGTVEEIVKFHIDYQENKYKEMKKPYP